MCNIKIEDPRFTTVKQRILVQLSKFSYDDTPRVAPFGMTQDGIAIAAGITRSHASLDLKKLVDDGLVEVFIAHVPNSERQRKVFKLTFGGYLRFGEFKDNLASIGIRDPYSILQSEVGRMPVPVTSAERMREELLEAIGILDSYASGQSSERQQRMVRHLINALNLATREGRL